MTQAQMIERSAELKRICVNDWGVQTSVELQAGRGTDPWLVATKYFSFWHHTVSTYVVGGRLTPVLYTCKVGRPEDGIPGPLCNGYIGYDRVFRIITLGEANHPGLGGPFTADGVTIPKNSARKPTFGIEVEGGLQTWEEIDRLGPDMLDVMGRVACALAQFYRRPLTSILDHCDWAPDRKVDRKGFCGLHRARAIKLSQDTYNKVKAQQPPKDWFDMATEAQLTAIVNKQTSPLLVRPTRPDGTIDDQVFIVSNDFTHKFWIGDWNAVAQIEYVSDLLSAGTWRQPITSLTALLIDQIPELENPVLGFSYKPKEGWREALAALKPKT